jgi:hypothetical protein
LDFFLKNIDTELGQKLDFDTSEKFPEHIPTYIKYLSKNLEKCSETWKKTIDNLKELEATLAKTAALTNGLSQNMLEFYNNAERLNMVINRKDESTKKLFLDAHKFFYDLGAVIRKEDFHQGESHQDPDRRLAPEFQHRGVEVRKRGLKSSF